jgi:hypothetical protein
MTTVRVAKSKLRPIYFAVLSLLIIALAAIVPVAVYHSIAGSDFTPLEAEDGTVNSTVLVAKTTDATASNNSYITFNLPACPSGQQGTWPNCTTPPPAQPLPTTRFIDWSGYTWEVRDNAWNNGAPQFNSNWAMTNVIRGATTTDPLTFKITNPDGKTPYAAQIATKNSLGYGTYTLHASGNFDTMDKSIVFGSMFTFDPTTPNNPGYNEIDAAEVSRWGDINGAYPNEVVKQTYYTKTNQQVSMAGNGFPWPSGLRDATFQIIWKPGTITLTTFKGDSTAAKDIVVSNTSNNSNVPVPAAQKLYINAWVYQYSNTGQPASSANVPPTTFILHSFSYVP